jgi:hypothetical protein
VEAGDGVLRGIKPNRRKEGVQQQFKTNENLKKKMSQHRLQWATPSGNLMRSPKKTRR